MKKVIKILSSITLVASLMALPFLGMVILFGLAGSTSKYFVMIGIGYVCLILFSLISIFKYKFFPAVIFGVLLIAIGFTLNNNFWEEHNDQLCKDLRADSTCVEDECGFDCSDFQGMGGFVTGGGVCINKDMTQCLGKTIELDQTKKSTNDALTAYSNIVDKIITSPNPQKENFEKQFIAIYNCLDEKYGPGAKGEIMATQILAKKKLSQEQLNKYYSYLSSKGRNVNTKRIVAGLPAGDKSLSCKDIK